jgi:gliding motility-associated-like protein
LEKAVNNLITQQRKFTNNKKYNMNIFSTFKNRFTFLQKVKKQTLFVAIILIAALQSYAQVPINDEPCNATAISAITLTPSAACTYTTFSNVDASSSTGPGIANPSCGNFTDADVWFTSIVPAGATQLVIDTRNLGLTDGAMTIYTATGTCPSLIMTEIACADVGSANPDMPKITVTQPAGTRIYIRMYGFGGEVGTFGICVTANIPPANDNCTNAPTLTVNNNLLCAVTTAGTTANATQSTNTPAPPCGTVNGWNDDVWYKFVATGPNHTVSLQSIVPTTASMVINIYSIAAGGDCNSLSQVGCANANTLTVTSLVASTTYYVRVYTNVTTATTSANFNICVGTPPPPPANDECLNATPLTVNPDYNCGVVTAGTTVSATQSTNTPIPTCASTTAPGGYNDDVWYSFVATSTGHRISLINITGVTTDMAFAVYSGTCTALTQVACSDPNLTNLTGLTIGTTYYIRVMTWTSTATSTASFNICVGTAPPPPANDDCPNAVALTVNPNYLCGVVRAGTTESATPTALAPAPSCSTLGANDDVWFTFVATNTSHRISLLNIVGSTTLLTTVVYSGTCGTASLTEVLCNTTNLFNATGLTVGQTYYVRVFTTSSTAGFTANFNICVGTPPPPPANDECTGAIPLTVNANQLCGVTTTGSTAGATQSASFPTPTCSGPNGWDDDVWYSFVATTNNHSVSLSNVTGTTTNMITTVYAGTCTALIQIACETVDPNFINLSTLTAGNTYYVRVQTELAAQDANFTLCVGTPGPGAVCAAGNPFCSTSGVVYPSVVNQPSLGGGTGSIYGCLGTTPNPTWFAFQVATPGNLVFQVSQVTNPGGVGIDVDYAAWGPFTSQANGCTQLATVAPPIQPISCSYSTAPIETITIPNALAGQWYIVLITNFNGGAGTINFNATTGNVGSTNCNIVCNTTATNNGPICVGGTFNLTATAIAGSTFSWTGPGFTSTAQNPTNVPAPTTPGSYVYNLTTTSGTVACAAATTVVVSAPPPVPTVISPLTYCQGATAPPLTATVTTVGNTLVFYTLATGGTGVPSLIPSTAAIGTITYYVSQKAGNCEGPRTPIVVNVVATTTPAVTIVTPSVTYCQGATAASLATYATPAAGGSLLWYLVSAGGTGSVLVPTPSTTASGSTTYYVSQVIGTCEGPRSPIVVNVTPYSPPPTGITSPVAYCQGAATNQLTAIGTSLLWYTTSTGGVGSTVAPTPSAAIVGPTTYYVTQNTNGCESLRVPITINVVANPTAPTVPSPTVVYCQGATATQLTASGPAGSTLTWYTVLVGGVALPSAPTPSTTTVGNTIYYVQAANGACISPRTAVTVTVNTTPSAPIVVSPVVYCQGATAVPLTATGTNLTWYVPVGGGFLVTTIAPTPNTANVGTLSYQVSSTIGACEGPKSNIVVTVNPTPAAPSVVTPVTYCQGATAIALTATGVGTPGWYTTATGGTASTTAPIPSTSAGGSTTYYVSSTLGTCEGPRSAITVIVTATPALPTVVSPVVYCQAATNAVPLTATGTSLLWYTTPTLGTGSTTAPTPSTTNAGNITYYVSQSTSGVVCEGPRAAIVVTINPKPIAPTAASPIVYCQNKSSVALTATGAAGNTFTWYTDPITGPGSATAIVPSTSTVGSTTYYVSQSALTCEGPRIPIVVRVSPALTLSAGSDVTIARGDQTQLVGITTGAISPVYLWTANVTPNALSATNILNPIANPIETTIYTLRLTDTTGPCPSITSTVKVEVIQSCINVRNAFTPNGDGVNDVWLVYDRNFCLAPKNGAKVNVFNRYGSKVFESQNYANTWDGTYKGKPVPDGTYYAVIEFVLFNGQKQIVKTDITVLR